MSLKKFDEDIVSCYRSWPYRKMDGYSKHFNPHECDEKCHNFGLYLMLERLKFLYV